MKLYCKYVIGLLMIAILLYLKHTFMLRKIETNNQKLKTIIHYSFSLKFFFPLIVYTLLNFCSSQLFLPPPPNRNAENKIRIIIFALGCAKTMSGFAKSPKFYCFQAVKEVPIGPLHKIKFCLCGYPRVQMNEKMPENIKLLAN